MLGQQSVLQTGITLSNKFNCNLFGFIGNSAFSYSYLNEGSYYKTKKIQNTKSTHQKKSDKKKTHTHTQLTKDKLRFKMHNTQFQEKNKNNDNMLRCMNELLFYQ